MIPTRHGLTLEEFLALPEKKPALEYLDGEVVQKVSPQGLHSTMQGQLCSWINARALPRKLGFAFPELRATFSGQSPVPDIAVYRWERIPRDARGRAQNRFTTVPDVAIEIASPEQRIAALIRRCERLVAHGVPLVLLANPEDDTVREFRDGQPMRLLRGADVVDLGPALPELRMQVDELFGLLVLE